MAGWHPRNSPSLVADPSELNDGERQRIREALALVEPIKELLHHEANERSKRARSELRFKAFEAAEVFSDAVFFVADELGDPQLKHAAEHISDFVGSDRLESDEKLAELQSEIIAPLQHYLGSADGI